MRCGLGPPQDLNHGSCVGFNPPKPLFFCMSQDGTSARDVIQRFLDGEISNDELQSRLLDAEGGDDREAMWAWWAEQGLFDEPVERDEWVSRKGSRFRTVRDDG